MGSPLSARAGNLEFHLYALEPATSNHAAVRATNPPPSVTIAFLVDQDRVARKWTIAIDRSESLAYALPYAKGILMPAERRVKLFKNGRNQAVRIPREFELPGEDAIMRKEGERLIIEPVPRKSLLELLATFEQIDEDFPEIDDPPPEPFSL
jgi:antitoxin VapB